MTGSRRPKPPRPRIVPRILLAVSVVVFPALAQPVGFVMQDEPLYLPTIGLEVHLPESCIADAGDPDTSVRAKIRPAEGDWSVSIQSLTLAAGEASAPQLTDEILDRLRKRFGIVRSSEDPETGEPREVLVETRVRPIERLPNLVVAGRPAERAYVSVPEFSGRAEQILGYTVVETSPTDYVVFELSSPVGEIGPARAAYETIIASATLTDANAELAERAKKISRGIELLSSIDNEQFDRAIELNANRFERLYIPSETGAEIDDTEIGYRRIRCWKGRRGELDPSRPPDNFDDVERDEGYLLRMDVRILQDGEPVDTQATYFQSLDGKSEAWRIYMTRRSGFEAATYREIGARQGSSLKIHIEGPGTPPTEIRPIFSTEGYISQISAVLLPQLLAIAGLEGDYAFYAYRTADQKVRMREDALKALEGRPGVFSLETVFREGSPPQVALLRDDGSIIRTTLPNDRVWEPTTIERLQKLWRDKALPLN